MEHAYFRLTTTGTSGIVNNIDLHSNKDFHQGDG